MHSQTKSIITTAVITALVVGFGTYLLTKPAIAPTVSPPPTASPAGSPSAENTSNWLTYTNPTYGITMKYPPFYRYTKRTNAFEAEDVPFSDGLSPMGSGSDYFRISVLLRKLDGMKFDFVTMEESGRVEYKLSATTQTWVVINDYCGNSADYPNQSSYDACRAWAKTMAPHKYISKSGIAAWVSPWTRTGSQGVGAPKGAQAIIESPNNDFVMTIDWITISAISQNPITDQTIYQMLDTLEIKK